jgi:hypothetical protein
MKALDEALIASIAAGTLRAATPVIYAGLGAVISERSGVINLGLEGLMLTGACAAVGAQLAFGHWVTSLLVAALAAGAAGLAHAFFCVTLRSSQVVTGLAFFFLCQGLTAVFGVSLVGRPVTLDVPPPLAALESVRGLGQVLGRQDVMVLAAFLATAIVSAFLFRTRWGILLRACGESATSAAAAGVPVRASFPFLRSAVAGEHGGRPRLDRPCHGDLWDVVPQSHHARRVPIRWIGHDAAEPPGARRCCAAVSPRYAAVRGHTSTARSRLVAPETKIRLDACRSREPLRA